MAKVSSKSAIVNGLSLALAGIMVVECWLWDQGGIKIRALVRQDRVAGLEAKLRKFIADQSPLLALGIYAAPAALLLPIIKSSFVSMSEGYLLGLVVFLISQTLLIASSAFLFDLCRDNLFQMPWFVRWHDTILRARAWASALVTPVWLRRREIQGAIRSQSEATFKEATIVLTRTWTSVRTLIESKVKLS